MQENKMQQKIGQTLESFSGAKRAVPGHFLSGRIMASISENETETTWTKLSAFISRPVVAFATIAIVLLLNAGILWIERSEPAAVVSSPTSTRDEFAVNTISLYDFENQE